MEFISRPQIGRIDNKTETCIYLALKRINSTRRTGSGLKTSGLGLHRYTSGSFGHNCLYINIRLGWGFYYVNK
jgi:hypothetical protein